MTEFTQIPDVTDIPGNAQELSTLMESDKILEEEILYLSGGVEAFKNRNPERDGKRTLSLEVDGSEFIRLIERILRYLGKMIDDVFDGSAASAIALSRVHSRAEEILLNSRSVRRSTQKIDFDIDTRIQNLCVKYKPVKDPQVLLQHLKVLNNIVSDVYRYLTYTVWNCYQDVVQFDPRNDDFDELAASMINSSPVVLSGNGRFIPSGLQIRSPQLLGCQQIIIQDRRPDGSNLDRVLASNMYLEHAEAEPRPLPEKITYDRFGISLEQSILKEVIDIVSTIAKYNTVNRRAVRRSRMEQMRLKIRDLQQMTESVTHGEHFTNYIRLLEVYSGWMMSPYVGLIALTHRNLTAVLNVCEGNSK